PKTCGGRPWASPSSPPWPPPSPAACEGKPGGVCKFGQKGLQKPAASSTIGITALSRTTQSKGDTFMALTRNRAVLKCVDEMAAMAPHDQIVWIDGSEAQLGELRAQACATGEMETLNEEKLPGCYLHRTAENDVARVEDRTFICCKKHEDAGHTN